MASKQEILNVKLEDLTIGKGQARTKDIGRHIDELADSIRVVGLLEPIIICKSDKPNKYEIVAGQRRFLAVKSLGHKTIEAIVRERRDETHAKVLSLTENMMRRDVTQKEKIDACTELFKKYGSVKHVVEETGLPSREVSQYVKFDRLIPQLKKLVESEGVPLIVALRAQDAASAGDGEPNPAEAVKLAKELREMSGVQQIKLVKTRVEDPGSSIDDVIESAKAGEKVTQVIVTLTGAMHQKLKGFAQSEGITQDEAAATLIFEGLEAKGFGA